MFAFFSPLLIFYSPDNKNDEDYKHFHKNNEDCGSAA